MSDQELKEYEEECAQFLAELEISKKEAEERRLSEAAEKARLEEESRVQSESRRKEEAVAAAKQKRDLEEARRQAEADARAKQESDSRYREEALRAVQLKYRRQDRWYLPIMFACFAFFCWMVYSWFKPGPDEWVGPVPSKEQTVVKPNKGKAPNPKAPKKRITRSGHARSSNPAKKKSAQVRR